MAGDKSVKFLSEKIDYESPPMNIVKYDIEDTKGKIRPYWILDRKNDFSIIIPVFPDNSTYLVGQYRVPIRGYSWEFSMGTVNNASPEKAARQELKEETGLTAKSWKKIGEFYLAPGICSQKGHVFIAEGLIEGEASPEEDEDLITKKVSLDKVKGMIKNQEIKDGPTIISWQLLQLYL
jgi:8-oxo-dGTP pyrophosphatase MutT (NUDIX family)